MYVIGYGYIINSNMQVQQTDKSTTTFSVIQNIATMKRFSYVMYYL